MHLLLSLFQSQYMRSCVNQRCGLSMLNFANGFGFVNRHPNQFNNKTISIDFYYQNARGLRTKLSSFWNNIESLKADIFAITETGCNASIMDAEIVPPGYQIIRCDRADGRKQGGAFLVATHGLELRRVNTPGDVSVDNCSFELVCATVHVRNKLMFLCCVVYIPPKTNEYEYMIFFRIIEQLCVKFKSVILLGDFNLNSSNENTKYYFEYFMSFCEFAQMNRVPNCSGRQLDLVLCSEWLCEDVQVCEADEPLVPVDVYHPPLEVALQLSVGEIRVPSAAASPVCQVGDPPWNFYKADYSLLYTSLASADWSSITNIQEPDEALECFYAIFNGILDNCVPRKRPKRTHTRRYCYPEWYTKEIISDIQLKAKLHKKYKSTGSLADYKVFSACRARIKECIDREYQNQQDRVQSKLAKDPKSFWDYIRTQNKSNTRNKIIKNGSVLSDSECATEFAKYFFSVYTEEPARLDVNEAVEAGGASNARVHVPQLTLELVQAALARLKPKRSAGPDGIPAFVMRDCRSVLAEPLVHIFNMCLETSYFPECWKVTRVIPILKGGDRTAVESFRPVAILSTPAKVFESAIQRDVQEQVASQLTDAQHGFRPARSTTSNLLNAMTYLVPHIDAGVQVDAAYFDFKKAFDLVDNDVLLSKLARIGCTPKLLHFFASYMRNRRQYVEFSGCRSEPYFTRSGVSQGSNVGPLQFVIMINDLPDVVRDARCLLFADDLKLLLAIEKEEDCHRLQRDIDRVVEWSRRNKLQFNVSKCLIMTFSRAKIPLHYDYKLNDTPMKREEAVRDLGVRMDAQLRFREHIVNVCKKAYKRLGFVLRRAASFTSIKAISALYDALIRSQLEGNAAVWAPHEAKYTLMLERIQNKFTRYMYLRLYGVYPLYPLMYPTLFVLGMVGYNKLETRRDLALASYVLGVFRGNTNNPVVLQEICLYVPNGYVQRRRRPDLFALPRARTQLMAKAPLSRTLRTLNLVAHKIDVLSCSLSEFAKVTLHVLCYGNELNV